MPYEEKERWRERGRGGRKEFYWFLRRVKKREEIVKISINYFRELPYEEREEVRIVTPRLGFKKKYLNFAIFVFFDTS